ncbi:MAG TPA: hypothetical protein V6D17_20250, partial [Candidatus Obscuribacterales bacterium]
ANLPVVMRVDTRNPPFSDHSKDPSDGGGHFIVVTDFNPSSGQVSIFNPWGRRYQKNGMHIKELWQATRAPKKNWSDDEIHAQIADCLRLQKRSEED